MKSIKGRIEKSQDYPHQCIYTCGCQKRSKCRNKVAMAIWNNIYRIADPIQLPFSLAGIIATEIDEPEITQIR